MKMRTLPVQLSIDDEHDIAYLSLRPGDKRNGLVQWSERHEAVFDFDREGNLVGIELLSARGLNEEP